MAVRTLTPIILASGSAIRQQMLRELGIAFRVQPSGFDETSLKKEIDHLPVAEQALRLAREKALSVSAQHPEALTIGADQMCALGSEILSKPGSFENAHAQLKKLSGRTHLQQSGVVLARGTEIVWQHTAHATLTVRTLSDAEIAAYVAADKPLQSCGAYKFEALGRHLFSEVVGDHDVVQGLPLTALIAELYRQNAIALLP